MCSLKPANTPLCSVAAKMHDNASCFCVRVLVAGDVPDSSGFVLFRFWFVFMKISFLVLVLYDVFLR